MSSEDRTVLAAAGAPLLSVITATYRAENTIGALARSLEQQEAASFEWIVQDGGSDDATQELVESTDLASVEFAADRDDGIYDAFNSALQRARGKYVLFLGADDRLASPGVLASAGEAIRNAAETPDAVLCSVLDERGVRFRSRLSPMTLVFNTVHHQGVLYHRGLFEGFRYRTDSKVVADYELNLLLLLRRARTITSDLVLSVCDSGGVSHTTSEWRLYEDLHLLRRRHLPAPLSSALLGVGLLNVLRRRLGRR